MTKTKRSPLGAILAESRMITQEDIERALAEQKRSGLLFGEALIKLGIVSDEDVEWGLANQFGLPFIRLSVENVDPAAAAKVDPSLCRRFRVVPYLLIDNDLTIVVADPPGEERLAELERETGFKINVCLGLESEIREVQDALFGAASQAWPTRTADFSGDLLDDEAAARVVADPTGRELVERVLVAARADRADAVYLEPDDGRLRVRFRYESELVDRASVRADCAPACADWVRTSLLHRRPGAGAAEGFVDRAGARYRASVVETDAGPSVSLLDVAPAGFPESLAKLDAPAKQKKALADLATARPGLIVVTGADAVRTIRLLALMLDRIEPRRHRSLAIGTVRWFDGLRYLKPTDGEEHILDALEQATRHGADLIVLEELWGDELVRRVLETAASGVQVVAPAAFPSAFSAAAYLAECAWSRVLFETGVRAIVGMRSFRTIDPARSTSKALTAAAAKKLGVEYRKGGAVREPSGPPSARPERQVLEFVEPTPDVIEALMDDGTASGLEKSAVEHERPTIRQQAVDLLYDGTISPAQLAAVLRG